MEDQLRRAEDLPGTPVVTLGGDDVAEVDEVLLHPDSGEIATFTLAKRTLFGGSLDVVLHREDVLGIGPDAVIVASADVFVDPAGEGPDGDDEIDLRARELAS